MMKKMMSILILMKRKDQQIINLLHYCIKISNLSSANVWICCVSAVQVFYFLLVVVKRFGTFCDGLWLLCRLNPAFFFAVMLMFSTMMIVGGIFFALSFPPLVGISSILPQFLYPFDLLLLSFQLLLLFLYLSLLLLLLSLLFLLLLLDGSIHVQILAIFIQSFCLL